MSDKNKPRPAPPGAGRPRRERRAAPGAVGSVRWIKSLLGRPVALERRDGRLHVTLVERRRSPERREADELQALRTELHARLLAAEVEFAARHLRHLVFVLDALDRGWPAVAALPSEVLHKAGGQAQRLVAEEASPMLAGLIERLRLLKVAAEVREDRQPAAAAPAAAHPAEDLHGDAGAVEVSELAAGADDDWVGTVPQPLASRGGG